MHSVCLQASLQSSRWTSINLKISGGKVRWRKLIFYEECCSTNLPSGAGLWRNDDRKAIDPRGTKRRHLHSHISDVRTRSKCMPAPSKSVHDLSGSFPGNSFLSSATMHVANKSETTYRPVLQSDLIAGTSELADWRNNLPRITIPATNTQLPQCQKNPLKGPISTRQVVVHESAKSNVPHSQFAVQQKCRSGNERPFEPLFIPIITISSWLWTLISMYCMTSSVKCSLQSSPVDKGQ